MPEVTHHFERAKRPMLRKEKYFREVPWAEALAKVSAELEGVRPDEFLMLVSPDLRMRASSPLRSRPRVRRIERHRLDRADRACGRTEFVVEALLPAISIRGRSPG